MRAKVVAVMAMAMVAMLAWVRYHLPFVHVPTTPVVTTRISPPLSMKKLGTLPAISSQELQILISQGIVYGMHVNGTGKTVLFLARTPNAPVGLLVHHWPPERFAAISILSRPHAASLVQWHADQKRIHWLRLSSRIAP